MHHHHQLVRSTIVALALALSVVVPAAAQGVLVAPHAVFIDHRTRSGWVQVHNPTTEPTEVSVEAIFGFPVTDSLGEFELRTIDHPDSTFPSAVGWLTAFPRKTVLQPQARQTIRLLVTPPANLPDGEYWARLVITAKGAAPPVTGADSTSGITVGLNLEIRTIIPMLYRKGTLTTGIAVSNLRAAVERDSVVVRSKLTRAGEAAYLGTVRGTLVAPDGKIAASFDDVVSVYYDVDPRFILPRAGLRPGRYRLAFEVTSQRGDIPGEQVIRAPAVRETIELVIP